MTRINLLPWREELRKERQKQFVGMLVLSAILGGVVWAAGHMHYAGLIDHQNFRNQTLEREIAELQKRIVKIQDLETTKARLIARMNVIGELQQGRPQIVHLFDQLVKTLPDGVHLISLKQSGQKINLTGSAESNARISSFMENLDRSAWLADPHLEVIEVKSSAAVRVSEYKLTVQQETPNKPAEKDQLRPAAKPRASNKKS